MTLTATIDDDDPAIQYSGEWTKRDPQTLDPNYVGVIQSIGGTLHDAALDSTPSFSYELNGE